MAASKKRVKERFGNLNAAVRCPLTEETVDCLLDMITMMVKNLQNSKNVLSSLEMIILASHNAVQESRLVLRLLDLLMYVDW